MPLVVLNVDASRRGELASLALGKPKGSKPNMDITNGNDALLGSSNVGATMQGATGGAPPPPPSSSLGGTIGTVLGAGLGIGLSVLTGGAATPLIGMGASLGGAIGSAF